MIVSHLTLKQWYQSKQVSIRTSQFMKITAYVSEFLFYYFYRTQGDNQLQQIEEKVLKQISLKKLIKGFCVVIP